MVNSTTISSSPNPKSSPKCPPEKVVAPPKNALPPRRIREVNSRYNQQSSSSSSSSLSSSFSSNSSSSSSISSRRSKIEEVSNAARVLSSTRRLSVSFQGEAFKLPVSKAAAKPAPVKGTPERGRVSSGVKDQLENGKISEVYRWPGRSKAMNSSFLTKSLDFGNDKSKLFGSSNRINDKCNKGVKLKSDSVKGFHAQCVDDNANFGSVLVKSGDFVVDNGRCKKGDCLKKDFEAQCVDDDANCGSILVKSGDFVVSDSDTVSFGSNVGGSVGKVRGGKRGIVVPARFLQDANSRVRKEVEVGVGTPKSKTNESKVKGAITPIGAKMYLPQTPVSLSKVASVSGRFVSPVRGGTRLASINKGVGSPVNSPSPRGRPSPTRTRNGMPNVPRDNATPSILSFTADMRRVRVGESRVNDAHELRMLYNRQLQWRFINARVKAALLVQSGTAEEL
ncbi:hypothetical protein Leryth_015216 [Lithospermum erythrorhizon]|nr:hypothetical protein Leryth_015216 [Lithospermum erythrorhizon]